MKKARDKNGLDSNIRGKQGEKIIDWLKCI